MIINDNNNNFVNPHFFSQFLYLSSSLLFYSCYIVYVICTLYVKNILRLCNAFRNVIFLAEGRLSKLAF